MTTLAALLACYWFVESRFKLKAFRGAGDAQRIGLGIGVAVTALTSYTLLSLQ